MRWGGSMWSIIKSHFHKGKTGFVITGMFVILSVLMMIVGLSICIGMEDLYYNTRNLSNSADMGIIVFEKVGGPLSNRIIYKINEKEDIELVDEQPMLYLEMPTNDNNYYCTFIFGESNKMECKQLNLLNIDDESNKFKPYIRDEVSGEGFKFYVTGNYLMTGHIGDQVVFNFAGKKYLGYVAGVYDDMCNIYNTDFYYVENSFYQLVKDFAASNEFVFEEQLINVRFVYKDDQESAKAQNQLGNEAMKIIQDFNMEQMMQNPQFTPIGGGWFNKQVFINATRPFILILGAAMIAFSVIVAIIVAVAIGFLVRSSVMDEVRNLGVFKALGYTTDMLRLSYLAIYGVISVICMIVGIILGVTLMPTFVNIITNMARLDCSRAIGLNVGSIFAAITLIVLVVGAVVLLATEKVKRITPLSAMRNNIETHSFKRKLNPLAKSKLPVNISLGAKSVVGEVNRSIMVVVVVLIMTILCSFVSVVFFNLKVDQTALIQMMSIENPDYVISLRYEDAEPYYDAIRQMDGYTADIMSEIYVGGNLEDGDFVRGQFYERFDVLRTNMVSKGRYPKYTNEIIVDANFAKQKGYDIGDSLIVYVKEFGKEEVKKECVVVGYFQSLFEGSQYMGYLDLMKEFIYPEKITDLARFFYFEQGKVPSYNDIIDALKRVNNDENINFGAFMTGKARLDNMILSTVETAADAVMSVFMSVTAIIISLLLVMLIKLKLLREKRNYAIYKAIGYTTPNIMAQIAVAMVILGVIGSLIGSIVGGLITTPILSLVGGLIGVGKFTFVIPWGYIVAIILLMPLLIYAISMLCAIPVKKIAPATLLRERG